MATTQPAGLDRVFGALADATRRQLLERLTCGPAATAVLAVPFDMSLPAVSKHLRVLEHAGLVQRDHVGREWRCRLVAAPLEDAVAWLEPYRAFWQHQLDRLTDYLQQPKENADRWPNTQSMRPSVSRSGERSRRRRNRSSPRGRRRKG